MNWSKQHITHIVHDLADENAFACRALFKIAEIVFTDKVPTLSVSITKNPVLKINLDFLNKHALSENDIKCVLMHEFLHVILRHTEKFTYNTPLLNIALDAVINALIHRTYGEAYSNFFCRLYEWDGVYCLLRPKDEESCYLEGWDKLHSRIYDGKYAADDLHGLLKYLLEKKRLELPEELIFIGNHSFEEGSISPESEELLNKTLAKMKGTGIWNSNKPGEGDLAEKESIRTERAKTRKWRRSVMEIIKKCMTVDSQKKSLREESVMTIPILNSSDRRALSLHAWSGLMPMARHQHTKHLPDESVTIYLDVSGSMAQEIENLVSLLYGFRKQIKNPLWVFSNVVEKATFKDGNLNFNTTSGTSLECVFEHIRKYRITKCIIVTDGYVDTITDAMLSKINKDNIRFIISAHGSCSTVSEAGMTYYQLKSLKS